MAKTIKELMAITLIPEILNKIADCKTEEDAKKTLWSNQSPALKLMLQYVFRNESNFTITELPPYTPDPGPIGISPSSLYVELKRFYVLQDAKDLPLQKKKNILIQILESVHPSEADLVGKILKKDLGIPNLTKDLVKSVFPELFNGEVSQASGK